MLDNKPKFGPEHYSSGSDIIRQGDMPDKFYIITRGTVQILDQPPDGLDVVLNHLHAGDFFGEVGFFKRSRRMATVRAVTDVDVMAMDYGTFKQWMDAEPDIRHQIADMADRRAQTASLLEPIQDPPFPTAAAADTAPDTRGRTPAAETATFFKAGEEIIRQGEAADTFYILLEGFVNVLHTNKNGRTKLVARLTSGDYFGEIGLLQGTPRIATVKALTDVKLLSFDRDTFRRWLIRFPGSKDDIAQTAARRRRDTGFLSLADDDPPANQ